MRPPALAPMLASNGSVPSGEGWAAEVKWDGFRIVATVSGGTLSLRSRPGSNATDWFPELAELPAGLKGHDAVLDGEVVICQNGRSAFHLLRRRFGGRSTDGPRATFMVLDLLWLDGQELYRLPWEQRRARLEALGIDSPWWQVPRYFRGDEEARPRGHRAQAHRRPLRTDEGLGPVLRSRRRGGRRRGADASGPGRTRDISMKASATPDMVPPSLLDPLPPALARA